MVAGCIAAPTILVDTLYDNTRVWPLFFIYFISAAVESLVSTTIFRRSYFESVENGVVLIRWVSYLCSAPIMMVIIGISVRVSCAATLFLMAVLVAITIITGYCFENTGRQGSFWLAAGFGALTAPFIVVWWSFAHIQALAPGFVKAIVALMSLLFYSFGLVPLIALRYEEHRPHFLSELAYCTMSIVSKSVLGWVFMIGIQQQS
jgi:hypothetical protein